MVRISDILKHEGQFPEQEPDKTELKKKFASVPEEKDKAKKEEPEPPKENIKQAPSEGVRFSKAIAKEESQSEQEMQLVKAMHQMQLDPADSKVVYSRALEAIKQILLQIKSNAALDLREVYDVVKIMVDRIVLGDKELLSLTSSSSQENYLHAHSVNVCILAIELGLGSGYNKSRLNELGLGAFLHDVGMVKVQDIANLSRPLSEMEYQEIKKHPIYSTDILSKVSEIQEGVMIICGQTHERLDGRGYPDGIKDERIHEYARITAVVDIYEALIHPRSHRQAMLPHDALKELLSIGNAMSLDASIIKILINKIGLYPVGSWVELNTGEIAKVISCNEDSPLRPKVNIIFGADREKLPQVKSIDLFRNLNVYVKESINPQGLNLNL